MASDGTDKKIGAGVGMAALRQGAKEFATALKAFPDSISVDEPGTLLSPTQGEIAAAREGNSLWDRVQQSRDRAATKESPEKDLTRE